ncbi:sodium/hydrogen exchanger 3 [Aspergillus luchuensis]|uniref:Sodium/hydrogen exchanger 3 n=1 Tax=Aspergillus kawachii TaxID=1069201 RepID=A0A146FLI9_ASPKA|nr:sodium/hydrogen exchanger 3 [Aspergillus luchuensis]
MVKQPSQDLAIGEDLARGKPARPCDWIRYSVGPPLDEQRKNARIGENTTASEIRELGLSYGRRMLIGSGGPAQDSCVRESRVGDHSCLVTKGSMIGARNIKRTCELDDSK